MPITVISNIIPANNLTFPIIEDIHLKGGLRVVADITERDIIDINARKGGMYVFTVDTGLMWVLGSDLSTWTQVVATGGTPITFNRATIVHTSDPIDPGQSEEFTIPTGKSSVLLNIAITDPARVEGHSTSGRLDLNPFVFEAYVGHLEDDGSYKDVNDDLRYNRRYIILSNLENPATPVTYWRISNLGLVTIQYQLTITFLTIEQ